MKHKTTEIKRALNFTIAQIKRGWTAGEALNQVETAYGIPILIEVIKALRRYFNKRERDEAGWKKIGEAHITKDGVEVKYAI